MKLEEIQELWSSDCVIDDTELDLESVKIPELHNKSKSYIQPYFVVVVHWPHAFILNVNPDDVV